MNKLGAVLRITKSRCVDFVGIGDSNQILNGHGWDHGWQYALKQIAPMFGTGLISAMENNGSGSGTGYEYARYSTAGTQLGIVLPESHNQIWDTRDGAPFQDAGFSESVNVTIGSGINVKIGAITLSNALRFEFDYATFASGAGSFTWQIRNEISPYTQYVSGTINTNTGVDGWQTAAINISADVARTTTFMGFRGIKMSTTATAPVGFLWYNVIDTQAQNGFRYTTLVYRGGKSLRTMAYDLQEMSYGTLTHFFSRLRARQIELHGTVKMCVMINSGLNDRNETLASVGPLAVADGDSPEAFADNMTAAYSRIKEIWTLNSWPANELLFVPMVSHPQSDPDEAELASYRVALDSWAIGKSDVNVMDFTDTITSAELTAGGYYSAGGNSHLTQAGYEYIANAMVQAAPLSRIRSGLTFPLTSSLVSSLTSPLVSR